MCMTKIKIIILDVYDLKRIINVYDQNKDYNIRCVWPKKIINVYDQNKDYNIRCVWPKKIINVYDQNKDYNIRLCMT